jgi:hypothetical protein
MWHKGGLRLLPETRRHISRQVGDIGQVSRGREAGGGRRLGLPQIQLVPVSVPRAGAEMHPSGESRGLETFVLIPLEALGPSQQYEMKGIPSSWRRACILLGRRRWSCPRHPLPRGNAHVPKAPWRSPILPMPTVGWIARRGRGRHRLSRYHNIALSDARFCPLSGSRPLTGAPESPGQPGGGLRVSLHTIHASGL